ncbi:MAG: tRNA pseudouridine(13) synthase TruD [Gammaproteobacteria bacterium]
MSSLPEWARAHGPRVARARWRCHPEDFQVEEVLGFAADGRGEHRLVRVEKRGANTRWVARELARLAGIALRDVSYAGLKDRHAVAIQHFSLWLGKQPDPHWDALASPEFRVLAVARHSRKLRTGALKGNRFVLTLRELSAPAADMTGRLQTLRAKGVPNYFGPQRFGRDGDNIEAAAKMFADARSVRDRKLRGLLLSAARSLIFNEVLSQRVQAQTWDTILPGEVCMLDGTHSVFPVATVDVGLRARCAAGDVHPTGPLWGRGDSRVASEVQALEARIAEQHASLAQGLEAVGLEPARRALRLPVVDLSWEAVNAQTLKLSFFLPAGAYATTVVRELIDARDTNQGDGDADED